MAEHTGSPASPPDEFALPSGDEARVEAAVPADALRDGTLAPAALAGGPADEELNRLRSLLFQREISFIEDLRVKLANPRAQAEDVAAVIAEAMIVRAGKDDRLGMALEPLVDGIVRDALHGLYGADKGVGALRGLKRRRRPA